MRSQALYPIGIVAELLGMHSETLRVWDREGLVNPQRRGRSRCFSDDDLLRLLFVKHLLDDEGFNLAGARAYLRLYPCWASDACRPCYKSAVANGKPCWKQPNAYCGLFDKAVHTCAGCQRRPPDSNVVPAPLRGDRWKAPAS